MLFFRASACKTGAVREWPLGGHSLFVGFGSWAEPLSNEQVQLSFLLLAQPKDREGVLVAAPIHHMMVFAGIHIDAALPEPAFAGEFNVY